MTKILVRQHGFSFLLVLIMVVAAAGLLRGLEYRLTQAPTQVLTRSQIRQGFLGTFTGEAESPPPQTLSLVR